MKMKYEVKKCKMWTHTQTHRWVKMRRLWKASE